MTKMIARAARAFWNALAGRKAVQKDVAMIPRGRGNIYEATLTIEHPTWKKPVIHRNKIRAISLSQVTKNLSTNSRQNSDLRLRGSTTWEDPRGAVHTLAVKKIETL